MISRPRLEQVCDQAWKRTANVEDFAVRMVFQSIVVEAAKYWDYTTDDADFCIQEVTPEGTVIFGSTNRLVWQPNRGFFPTHACCTARFLEHYDRIGPVRGGP